MLILSPGAAPTPRAARPDWAEASAFRPDPVALLDRSAPANPSTLSQRLTLLDALSLFAVAALIGGMLAVGHS